MGELTLLWFHLALALLRTAFGAHSFQRYAEEKIHHIFLALRFPCLHENRSPFSISMLSSPLSNILQYGLQSAFSEIERLNHEVIDAGNPIKMNMKTRYVVKGLGKEQTVQSLITIATDSNGKITKVEDKWDGKLPESSIANVSLLQLFSPFWWLFYIQAWMFWLWSLTWETRVWRVSASALLVFRIL